MNLRHLVLIAIAASLAGGCRDTVTNPRTAEVDTTSSPPKPKLSTSEVEAFCGGCHAPPDPQSFIKDAWLAEVDRGYEFYYLSGRTDLAEPPKAQVYAYYRELAPENLNIPDASAVDPSGDQFRREVLALPDEYDRDLDYAISHLKWVPDNLGGRMLVSDMRRKEFWALRFDKGKSSFERIANNGHYAHAAEIDLSEQYPTEYLLSNLGSFQPEEHHRGSVNWLRNSRGGEPFEEVALAEGLSRVADARPADFDRDGDIDIVVAEFGLIKTGRILLLRNEGSMPDAPDFNMEVLDDRHGSIHVLPIDMDNDGWMDFITLISQEYESIELFRNDHSGGFTKQTIYATGDPASGSSGIELVDLDQDGDLDIVYTNGDMFDSYDLKPSHGVYWIENGQSEWHPHELCKLPGAFRAMPADLDLDGDLDLICCSFVPPLVRDKHPRLELASIGWLEQIGDMRFEFRTLELDKTHYAALETGDFDHDGDIDFMVGRSSKFSEGPIDVWWNKLQ